VIYYVWLRLAALVVGVVALALAALGIVRLFRRWRG
jgi:hypothetical protein